MCRIETQTQGLRTQVRDPNHKPKEDQGPEPEGQAHRPGRLQSQDCSLDRAQRQAEARALTQAALLTSSGSGLVLGWGGPRSVELTLGDSQGQEVGVPWGLTGSAKALSHSTVAVALWSWLP